MTDIELLQRHRDGDEAAFPELTRRHLGWVLGVARRRVRDAHLAEDVAQAVFVLLHRKSPAFPNDRAMMGWMHKSARYAAATAARTERRRQARETEMAKLQPCQATEDDSQWDELAPMLDEMVGRLSRADRETILLRYYRDLTFAEIAAELGTTEEAARKRAGRAVEKLRQMADKKGVPVSAGALALGLAANIRILPPPGLLATSSIVATSQTGAAATASTIAIVKGALIMSATAKLTVIAAGIAAVVLIAGTAVVTTSLMQTSQQRAVYVAPPSPPVASTTVQQARTDLAAAGVRVGANPAPQNSPSRSPFSDLRWRGSVAEVKVNGVWYELVAINNTKAADLVNFAKQNFGDPWQQRIAQNLPDLMEYMNSPLGDNVSLQLKKLDNGEAVALTAVPMTARNAVAIRRQAAGGSPFSGVRWNGIAPQVQVNGAWYDLVSLDGVPAEKIVQFAKDTYGDRELGDQILWQKRFSEDLGQVMSRMHHDMGETVSLQLRRLNGTEVVNFPNVALTEANRDSILAQRGAINPR